MKFFSMNDTAVVSFSTGPTWAGFIPFVLAMLALDLFGSVAYKIMHLFRVPVMVVP